MRPEAARPARWISAVGHHGTGLGVAVWLAMAFGACRPSLHLGSTDAQVRVVNLADISWEIRILPAARGAREITAHLYPHEVREVPLPAGEYRLRQTLLAARDTESQSRDVTLQVAKGVKYTWPLATLLTTADVQVAKASPISEGTTSRVSKH